MKTSTLLSSLLAAVLAPTVNAQAGCVSSAQSLVPSCGQSCLLSAKSALGCTVETDYACGCSQSSALQNNAALTQCVLSACNNNIETALQVSSGAQQICSCVATAAAAGPTTGASAEPTSAPAAASSSAPAAGSTPAASEPEASGSGATSSSAAAPTTLSTVVSPPTTGDGGSSSAPGSGEGSSVSACPVQVTVLMTTTVTATVGGETGGSSAPGDGGYGGSGEEEGSCKGLEGVDYLVCCASKIFTLGN